MTVEVAEQLSIFVANKPGVLATRVIFLKKRRSTFGPSPIRQSRPQHHPTCETVQIVLVLKEVRYFLNSCLMMVATG